MLKAPSSYFSGRMINVTRMKSPTVNSILVTFVLKLLMTLLWTLNTPHDKIDEHCPGRKSKNDSALLPHSLSQARTAKAGTLDGYVLLFSLEMTCPLKHIHNYSWIQFPISHFRSLVVSLSAWGEKAINFYLCPFMCRRKICIINNYLTFLPSHKRTE